MRLPYWLPNVRSWFNAVALILLMIGIGYLMDYAADIISILVNKAPWLLGTFLFLLFAFPIITIAFLHHWLHTFLDVFFPDSRFPEDELQAGWFPSIFSWWEAVFGWTSYVLASVFVLFFLGIFSSYSNLFHLLSVWGQNLSTYDFSLPSARFTILQIIVAACLYQLEYLVRQRLVATSRQ
ncbi:MAG: hypothetical protein MJK14_23935 [Rivularia sp. ALOHA_DT_140]|nr:hypothetical protein [Rivularia sp. ALOHA_DT_140]